MSLLQHSGDTPQIVFIFGENHCLHETINEKQFTAMLEVIKCKSQMKIFLEVPHSNQVIPQNNTIKCIVHGLPHAAQGMDATIVNCDIRNVEGAASILLSFRPERRARLLSFMPPEYDGLHKQFAQDCISFFGCRFDTLRFEDLLTEHENWFRRCTAYRDSWSNGRIKKAFDQRLLSSHHAINHFKEFLKTELIDPHATVHEYSSQYWDDHESSDERLLANLHEAFSDFLDMHVLHQLFLLQSDPTYDTIVVCTGSTHARNIARALKQSGYRQICEPQDNVQRGIITPDQIRDILLTPEELETNSCPCVVM